MNCGLEQGIIANTYNKDTTQNNVRAENIVISCSLVLSLVSETENEYRPRLWLLF